jgi:DNA-binding MarR family transcriptional regulator
MPEARTDAPPLGSALLFMSALWDLNHSIEVMSVELLRTHGITAQQRFLIRIVGRLGPISAGRLARVLHVHPGTLSNSLSRLERRGIVARRRDPLDARRVLIHLTARGRHLDERLPPGAEHAMRGALRRLGTRQARSLLRSLVSVAQHLTVDETSGSAPSLR